MAGPLENPEAPLAPSRTWFRDRLSVDECLAMLATCRVGRVGAIVNGRPVIVPAAYVSDGAGLLVRVDGNLLDEAMHHVAFEVEATDSKTGTGWSVVVQGAARDVTDQVDSRDLDRLGPAPDGHTGRPSHWIRIRPSHIIGRRLPGEADKEAAA